jgi:tetratricopeptide (TPR) repeat protein
MNSNEVIEQLVIDLSKDSFNPAKNLDIAVEYERLGQTASAVSFYLRAAEYSYDKDLLVTYAALLRTSECLSGQRNRNIAVNNLLLQAIAYLPTRPEAYLLMSKFHENAGNWQEAYSFASMGSLFGAPNVSLPISVGYPGWFAFDFQKAVSAWWIGRKEESTKLLLELHSMTLPEEYAQAVKNNLEVMGIYNANV